MTAILYSQFCALATPTSGTDEQVFSAASIERYPHHKIAKSAAGYPAVLIDARSDGPFGNPLHLKNISVSPQVECSLTYEAGGGERRTYTIVSLDADDPILQEFFLAVIETLLPQIGNTPTLSSIQSALEHLTELFKTMANPPRKTAAGLWGELFFIRMSRNPILLLDAWHADPHEAVDFVHNEQRVEVKTTSGQVRRHRFSATQLLEPEGTCLIIASLFARRVASGLSVARLISQVRRTCAARLDLVRKLDMIVAASLGSAFIEALELEFDEQLAASTLGFYRAAELPALRPPFPAGVTEVEFSADLSDVTEADIEGYPSTSLFGSFSTPRQLLRTGI
jgi:hypothetical protein